KDAAGVRGVMSRHNPLVFHRADHAHGFEGVLARLAGDAPHNVGPEIRWLDASSNVIITDFIEQFDREMIVFRGAFLVQHSKRPCTAGLKADADRVPVRLPDEGLEKVRPFPNRVGPAGRPIRPLAAGPKWRFPAAKTARPGSPAAAGAIRAGLSWANRQGSPRFSL